MTAGWYWTRATWRRAARGAAVLALLVGLGVGGAIGAAAGARRTASAYDRLAARSNPPHAFLFSADAGAFDRIARRPEVAAATGYVQLGLQPAGVPCSDRPADYYQVLVPAAGAPFTVPKPRLLRGRYADPSAPDEAVVSEQHARRLRIGVGDTIRYLPYDVADGGDIVGCLKTTVAKVRVVGVIRELFEIGAGDEPTVAATYLTPAFRRDHPDAPAITGVNGFARLKAGTNVDRFAADVAANAPRDDNGDPMAGAVTIQASRPMGPALDALAFGLWVLAGAMAAAAAVAVTVAIVRQVAATGPDLRLLSALGLSRRQAAVAVAAPMLVALCVGLGLAVVVAAAVSTVHLIGVAAAAEPDPGLALDAPLLLAGLSIAALASLAVIALATWRGAARALDQPENDTAGRPGVVDRSLRQRLPPWAAMGSSYALGPGRRGAASVPARAVALAVGAATAGLVAVLVFGVGVTHAKGDPTVYGFGTWDGFASNADEESDVDVAPIAAADPDVATVARLSVRFKLPIGGTTINGFAVENVEGQTGPTVVTGRLPAGAGEIALGKDTAALLRAGVGSAVAAEGPKGSHRLRVVGIAAFPNIDSDALATGWVADRAAIDALGWPPGCNDESECFNTVAFSWRPGSDAGRATRRLHDGGVEIEPAHPGREVILVGDAARVPAFGVAGLGLVAALSLAHTLSVTVTRRRRELAVARAIGFDRRQAAGVIVAESVALAVVGGVAGGVAGLAAGRSAWRAAARSIGIGPELPSIAALVVLVAAGVLILSLALAAVPARRAARSSPAAGLRSDE